MSSRRTGRERCDMSSLRERNFERLRRSIAGEACDAHACFNYYTYPFYYAVTGVDLKEYFHNPKLQLDTQLEVLEKLERCGNPAPDVGSVAEASSLGGVIKFGEGGFISVHESGIEDIDDVMRIKPGNPYDDNYMRVALETLEYMVNHVPKEYRVNPPCLMGTFTVAAQLRGISDFCADIIEDPEMVEALLEVVQEAQIRYLKEQEKILGSLHHVLVCDDLSAFLSEEDYRKWVLPCYDRVFAEFPNTQRWYHNDANTVHLASAVPDGGMRAWQYGPCLKPQEAAALTQNRLTLLGGLNPLQLAKCSVAETEELCNRVLDEFAGNPRLVLSAEGSVNEVPVENLLAMLRVADQRKID